MICIDKIRSARRRLDGHVRLTPIISSPFLDKIAGRRILIKAECLQHTGSFKYRGAWAAISALDEGSRKNGVVAYSSGNHAQAIAAVAKEFGVPAVIVMPSDAPSLKIENTRAYGAEVVIYDRYKEVREEIGLKIASVRGLTLIKPYDDENVIAGQGTLGLEIASQVRAEGVRTADVLVCCGGGGLASGVALALSEEMPELRVRPCEPEFYDDTARSLISGNREINEKHKNSICDAILTPTPGEITFPILARFAGPGLVVSEKEVLIAMSEAFRRLKLVTEPGGVVALASALSRRNEIETEAVVVVITGGNVDPKTFSRALNFSHV